MMKNGFICESANIDTLDPEFSGVPIARQRIDNSRLDVVLVQQLRLRRTNATLVFQRYDA